MRKTFVLLLALTAVFSASFAQDITGTWYGFQTSRDKGVQKEYRITVDFTVTDDSVTGTMSLKAEDKGTIVSKFSGTYDAKKKTMHLNELGVLTDGLNEKDFSLCEYSLKLDDKVIRGKGRASNKGFDHLSIYLQRNPQY